MRISDALAGGEVPSGDGFLGEVELGVLEADGGCFDATDLGVDSSFERGRSGLLALEGAGWDVPGALDPTRLVAGLGAGFSVVSVFSCCAFSVAGTSAMSVSSSSDSWTYSADLNLPSGFAAGLRSAFLVTRPVKVLFVAFLLLVGARLAATSFSPARFFCGVGPDLGTAAVASAVLVPLLAFSVSGTVVSPSLPVSSGFCT